MLRGVDGPKRFRHENVTQQEVAAADAAEALLASRRPLLFFVKPVLKGSTGGSHGGTRVTDQLSIITASPGLARHTKFGPASAPGMLVVSRREQHRYRADFLRTV
jgi:hypothetical protein